METIKRAIIVAAGQGTRMRPLTDTCPKPLVRVHGKPIIDSSIEALKKAGIEEINIVVGYRKEMFYEAYGADPAINLIENPYYADGNNITSLYVAREHLPGAFVIEGDLLIRDPQVFAPQIDGSKYCAIRMETAPEWALDIADGVITDCRIEGGGSEYRLMGISMWTEADGARLSELIRRRFEEKKDWSVYWDEIALSYEKEQFRLGVREIGKDALLEIDTIAELAAIDPAYEQYVQQSKQAI